MNKAKQKRNKVKDLYFSQAGYDDLQKCRKYAAEWFQMLMRSIFQEQQLVNIK